MKYATGKHSLALCDRCGQQYDYVTLRKEWTGFRVCPECFEQKHPQLEPRTVRFEPEALWHPRPDEKEPLQILVGQSVFPPLANLSLQGVTSIGRVGLEISDTGPTAFVRGFSATASVGSVATPDTGVLTGVAGTGSVGAVTIVTGSSTASRFDSTSVKLDSTTKTFDEG